MSPAEIRIAIHYWTIPGDYDGPESIHFVKTVCSHMAEHGLLRANINSFGYTVNEDAMRVYIEALCAVPWPVEVWVIPKEKCDDRANPTQAG